MSDYSVDTLTVETTLNAPTSATTTAEITSAVSAHSSLTNNPHATTKAQVGLGNCDNTSDLSKPISTLTQTALNLKYDASNPNSYQTAAQVTASIQAVVAAAPAALDTLNEIAAALGNDANFASTVTNNLALKAPIASPAFTGTVSGITKAMVGLGSADNTSDLAKPISTLTQTALNLKYDASNPSSFETSSQLNTRDTNNRNRSNHTGSQLAATISDFSTAALGTVLTGVSFVTATAILATDSIIVAFGKLQAQLTQAIADVNSTFLTKADKLLTGIVFTDTSNVVATDEVLGAIGKLQAQSNLWREFSTTAVLTNNSNTTLTSMTELSFAVTAGKNYRIESMLRYRSTATNTGMVLTAALGGGAAGTLALIASIPSGVDGIDHIHQGSITSSGDLVTAPTTPTSNLDFCSSIEGIFACTTSGTLTPQFRSEVNGQTITVQIGSNLIVREF